MQRVFLTFIIAIVNAADYLKGYPLVPKNALDARGMSNCTFNSDILYCQDGQLIFQDGTHYVLPDELRGQEIIINANHLIVGNKGLYQIKKVEEKK